jgi:hypothetical protein
LSCFKPLTSIASHISREMRRAFAAMLSAASDQCSRRSGRTRPSPRWRAGGGRNGRHTASPTGGDASKIEEQPHAKQLSLRYRAWTPGRARARTPDGKRPLPDAGRQGPGPSLTATNSFRFRLGGLWLASIKSHRSNRTWSIRSDTRKNLTLHRTTLKVGLLSFCDMSPLVRPVSSAASISFLSAPSCIQRYVQTSRR